MLTFMTILSWWPRSHTPGWGWPNVNLKTYISQSKYNWKLSKGLDNLSIHVTLNQNKNDFDMTVLRVTFTILGGDGAVLNPQIYIYQQYQYE